MIHSLIITQLEFLSNQFFCAQKTKIQFDISDKLTIAQKGYHHTTPFNKVTTAKRDNIQTIIFNIMFSI